MGLAHLPNPEPQTSQPPTYTTSHKHFIKTNHIHPNQKPIITIKHKPKCKNNSNFSTRLVLLKNCPPKFT